MTFTEILCSNFIVFNLENTGDTWFLFPDIMMMSTKLIRNILSIPKLLQATSFSCSRCLDNQVSGSLILYVYPNKVSLKKLLISNGMSSLGSIVHTGSLLYMYHMFVANVYMDT